MEWDVLSLAVIALALACLALAAAAVWLYLSRATHRARLLGEVAALADRATRAEADAQRLRVESAALSDAREQAAARVLSLSTDNAALAERLEAAERDLRAASDRAREDLARLERERAERQREFAQIDARFRESFASLSGDTLRAQTEQFLALAQHKLGEQRALTTQELDARRAAVESMVKPLAAALEQTRAKVEQFDRDRAAGHAALTEQIAHVLISAGDLSKQTAQLAKALSRPEVRGRYGEIQLRRVAELAGMVAYCDFSEQASVRDAEGTAQRPDMIVRLPNERVIVVDAKANLDAYLDAAAAGDDAQREAHLERFARHIADQARKLGDKHYWKAFDRSPDFVVMFVPGDQFIDAALARQPDILERAAQSNVILASPSTLIGLLRAVAVGWREHDVNQNARELIRLGAELHERALTVAEHTARLGRSLTQAVNGYNDLVGSIDSRLLPSVRRFEERGAKSGKQIEAKLLGELRGLDEQPRRVLSARASEQDAAPSAGDADGGT